jgi:hypothetical protein
MTQLNSFRETVIYLRYLAFDYITHMMTITRRGPVELHIRMCLLGLLYQVNKKNVVFGDLIYPLMSQ